MFGILSVAEMCVCMCACAPLDPRLANIVLCYSANGYQVVLLLPYKSVPLGTPWHGVAYVSHAKSILQY